MLKGFKEFISRGNAVDLAVGVVIGAAFGAVVTALVDSFINPLIAAIFGKPDMSDLLTFTLRETTEGPVVMSIGAVLTALLNFLIVAAAIYFMVVVPLNKLANLRKKDEPAIDEAASPTEVELLTEIRDALKQR